jgi:hypothetical protein
VRQKRAAKVTLRLKPAYAGKELIRLKKSRTYTPTRLLHREAPIKKSHLSAKVAVKRKLKLGLAIWH